MSMLFSVTIGSRTSGVSLREGLKRTDESDPDVAAECDGLRANGEKIVRYKVAFQWCDGQGDPWWSPPSPQTQVHGIDRIVAPIGHALMPRAVADTSDSPAAADIHASRSRVVHTPNSDVNACTSPATVPTYGSHLHLRSLLTSASRPQILLSAQVAMQCSVCAQASVQVYTVGWMCLNPNCRSFWTINGFACSLDGLTFDDSFTALQPQPPDMNVDLRSLTPPPPPTGGSSAVITSRRYSRGMHCTACGRLSCRFRWSRYICSNCGVRSSALFAAFSD